MASKVENENSPPSKKLKTTPQSSVVVQLQLGHTAVKKDKPSKEGYTHDWKVFVCGLDDCAIQHFIEKVVFHLPDSFTKHRRVIKKPPFQVSESSSAGFTIPIDVYFRTKEEPKKKSYNYDLYLRVGKVSNIRLEKLTFQNPILEFREKLLLGGGATIKEVDCAVAEASNHFGMNLYNSLAKDNTNVFISPFCISTALAMIYFGAEGETADEMRKVLGYEVANIKDEELELCFQKLLNALDGNQKFYTLNCANSVLSHEKFHVKKEYKSHLENFFKALYQEVDFIKEDKKVVKLVNDWVSEKTNKMIPKILDSLDPDITMIILNAVYFKGLWKHPFSERFTYPNDFYNKGDKDNCKKVDMMNYLVGKFLYTKKESYKALELPYKGDDISMMILLPDSKDGLRALENSLNSTFIQDIKQSMSLTNIRVTLPKFTLQYSKSLKTSLQTMGLKRVFSTDAYLNAISDSGEIFLSEAKHLAVLIVSEEGTEAASVSGFLRGGGYSKPGPEPPTFIVDHPFMFVIYNTKNNLILFMGRVNEL